MLKRVQHDKVGKQSGFTLVEMAIVLIIIALIASGIFVGQNMIQAATVKAVVSEIEEYQSAFNVFVDKYSAYPGDYNRANTFLGAMANEVGDGDGRIEWTSAAMGGGQPREGPLAWHHLSLAGLVGGDYSNAANLADDHAQVGVNIPRAKIGGDGAGYHMNYDPTTPGGISNHLALGLQDTAGLNNEPAVTPADAESMDRKLDDGLPRAGVFQMHPGSMTNCYQATTPPTYLVQQQQISCLPGYKLD